MENVAFSLQDGEKMLREGHWAPEAIQSRLQEIDELWDELLENCHEKRRGMQDTYKVRLYIKDVEALAII